MPPPSSPSPPLIHLPRRVPVHGAGRFTIEELEDIGFDPSILKINSFIKIDGDDDDDEHYYKPLPPTRPTGKAAVLPTGEASSQLPTGEEWKRVDEEPGGYLDPEVAGVEALMEKLKEMRQKRPKSA